MSDILKNNLYTSSLISLCYSLSGSSLKCYQGEGSGTVSDCPIAYLCIARTVGTTVTRGCGTVAYMKTATGTTDGVGCKSVTAGGYTVTTCACSTNYCDATKATATNAGSTNSTA